jgi:N-acetylneuraminate synthase
MRDGLAAIEPRIDRQMKHIQLGGRLVGEGEPCFVIAEAGVNHDGSLDKAVALVDVAVKANADAVKFQTFRPELLATRDAGKASYQKETTEVGESQYAMLERLALSFDEFAILKRHCEDRNIIFLSTPFDRDSADFLDGLGMVGFKIPSGELVNLPFLAHLGSKRKPAILSTGMGSMAEVEAAVRVLETSGCPGMAILQCVSNYPAAAADANLRAMATIAKLGHPVGYSDHTMGLEVALASVALGASVLEKHFTLSRRDSGPDHRCSLEPDELTTLVSNIRNVEASLGSGRKEAVAAEQDTASVARRSLFLREAVEAGAEIAAENLEALRPGDGISPALFANVVGRKAKRPLSAWHKLTLEDLA